jgi:hypothetical protein
MFTLTADLISYAECKELQILALSACSALFLAQLTRDTKLDDHWNLVSDENFCHNLLSQVWNSPKMALPQVRHASKQTLCENCIAHKVWQPTFQITYDTTELQILSEVCALCKLFWEACVREDAALYPTVRFERVGSSLRMNGTGAPVLRICRTQSMSGLQRHMSSL